HAGSSSESRSASKPIVIGGTPIPGTARTRWQRIDFDTDIAGLTLRGLKEWTLGGFSTHTLSGGLDFSNESSENRFFRIDSGLPQDRISFAPADTLRAGIHLQDEISLRGKFLITPGLRLDWQETTPRPNAAY